MDPNEIFEYATEGMKWLAISGASTYVSVMLSDPLACLFSEKIRNQQELDVVVEEESRKLVLERAKGKYTDRKTGISYIQNGIPTIELGGFGATRSAVRHELYHIYKGDCDEGIANRALGRWPRNLRYWFLQEPKACLYGTFKIKL